MRYIIGILSLACIIGSGAAIWLGGMGIGTMAILVGMACISAYAIWAGFGKARADRKLREMREAVGDF